MNHNFLSSPTLNLKTIIFFLTVEIALSVNPQFISCSKPSNCGNNINIAYPFWIQDKQQSYCGYPGFGLSCKNLQPILNLSGKDYIIREIFYNNQSFRLANNIDWNSSDSCPYSSLHNLTIDTSRYKSLPNQSELIFFFNCNASLIPNDFPDYSIGCSSDNSTRRSLALFGDDGNLSYVKKSGNCETPVMAVIDNDGGNASFEKMLYRDRISRLLNKGFLLRWNARNCSVCEESGGRCGFDFDAFGFVCFCPDRPHLKRCHGPNTTILTRNEKSYIEKKLGIGLGAGACGFLLSCFVFFIYRARFKRSSSRSFASDPYSKTGIEYGSTYCGAHIFSYTELNEATNNFDISKELGDGGFGTVYHGQLRDGRVVAVKRLFENNYKRVEQFRNEVEILTRLRHKNLVSLYGCTSHNSRELLLVYEFVSNGTVADHLHGDRSSSGMLTWPIRMSIAIETASALAYLHASDIIHRDVKTNNILLDNNCGVKVGDFGLSRPFPTNVTHVSTTPQGTPGYVDPKYYQCYQLTDKSDVYSFGVVLFELISSKPAVDICRPHHEINLSSMAVNRIQNRALHELVDPSLGFDSDCKVRRVISMVAELAYRCLQQEKEMRPSMVEVLEILKGIEREDWKVGMAEEVDIPTDDIGLLMENHQPFSSDSTTDKSTNVCSTPNTIG